MPGHKADGTAGKNIEPWDHQIRVPSPDDRSTVTMPAVRQRSGLARFGPAGIAALVAVPLLALGVGAAVIVPTMMNSDDDTSLATPTTSSATGSPSSAESASASPSAENGLAEGIIASPSASAGKPGASSSASRRPSTKPTTAAASDKITKLENQVTALVNAERAKVCKVNVNLRTDERLRTAARRHSADMATNNYFSHTGLNGSTFVQRVAATGYPAGAARSENIAYGYKTPEDVMKGWMNSDGHRRNILDCSATELGVGLAYKPDGTPYWTQDFGTDK